MPNPTSAIILTALSKEYLAVRAHLDNLTEVTHKGTVYELGRFLDDGRSWTVAIVEVGRHNENAAVEAERAINHFQPHIALFVGVAGGLKPKDLAIGDVIAATKVYGYKSGKSEHEFLPTPEVYRSSHDMEQRARAVSRSKNWMKRIKGPIYSSAPNAFVEPIAAGPEVVKSTQSATYEFLRSNYSDAIAVDMEGLGFLAAVHANPNVQALVVRGISDHLDHKNEADASGSQEIASQNVAAFAFEILAKLDFEQRDRGNLIENIPYHQNRNFTGRGSSLYELHKSLASGEYAALTQAITGLGGVGKTQLALEYSYLHTDDYGVLWWVKSDEPATLANDYASLANELGLLKDVEKIDDRVKAVRMWLESNAGWLMIFDNAWSPTDLDKYLPKRGSGHVIITSRNPHWESLAKLLEVQVFERPESVKFLLKRADLKDEKATDILAETLGDLPLALEQAGAYIKETGISVEDYLERFRNERKKVLEHCKPGTYGETIAKTWNMSVKAASEEAPASYDLLNLCAYLAPDLIPRALLADGSRHIPEPLASTVKDIFKFDRVLASLRRYSLINYSIEGFSVHRMVQAAIQDGLEKECQKNWAEAAVRLVDDAFPKDHLNKPQSWPCCALLLPHSMAATRYAESLGADQQATSRLLNNVGQYLQTSGEFDEAKATLQRALKISEKIYGPEHPEVAIDVNNLGSVLQALGELQEARKCLERAIKIDEIVYGPEHPEVAIDVNNLGEVLRDLGELQEARKCLERAIKIDEMVYGPEHPAVARDVNNLGLVLRDLGELQEARKRLERAIKIDEMVYGPEHPAVARDVNNLGLVLRDLGELQEARKCLERTIKIDDKVYGPEHPEVARGVNNLGLVLRDLGELQEARKCLERTLKIFQDHLGKNHPSTRTVRENLDLTLDTQS